jgi:hypothetical protein
VDDREDDEQSRSELVQQIEVCAKVIGGKLEHFGKKHTRL